ncbi:hypothetical protein N7488_005400 [Penicillium malachiteum]|nr:hypothetical protein N7488_005400 [Penicillium malachiteum]
MSMVRIVESLTPVSTLDAEQYGRIKAAAADMSTVSIARRSSTANTVRLDVYENSQIEETPDRMPMSTVDWYLNVSILDVQKHFPGKILLKDMFVLSTLKRIFIANTLDVQYRYGCRV